MVVELVFEPCVGKEKYSVLRAKIQHNLYKCTFSPKQRGELELLISPLRDKRRNGLMEL